MFTFLHKIFKQKGGSQTLRTSTPFWVCHFYRLFVSLRRWKCLFGDSIDIMNFWNNLALQFYGCIYSLLINFYYLRNTISIFFQLISALYKCTVKVLVFVDINYCDLGKKHKLMDSWICNFDDPVIQFKVNNPFHWESNFVVYLTHEIHENWYPTNNITFTVYKNKYEIAFYQKYFGI